jgi:dTDP-4-amino-4,6-dideoxygalactose transaminase
MTSKTKAVMPVDLFGQIAPIEQYLAAMPGLPLIEDAAQTIGARRKIGGQWTMAGERATIGTFSYFPSKNLGGYGDGGMIVTQDDAIAARLFKLRTHGATTTYYHDEVGFNSRLDALQAAVLLAKMPHLAAWSAARREHAAYYNEAFKGHADIRTPVIDPNNESIYNQYTIRVPRRDELQAHLKAKGIGNAVYYPLPLHLQKCFAYLGLTSGRYPESERAAKEVLSLPVYPELTRSQQNETIAAVREFYGR